MVKSIKEKLSSIKETIEDEIHTAEKTFQDAEKISSDIAKQQGGGFKKELKDLEKIRKHHDLIYYKSDAIAIVLRKMGDFDSFLKIVDRLTREGYRIVNSENIKNLLANYGITLPGTSKGTLYYFQNKKYIN